MKIEKREEHYKFEDTVLGTNNGNGQITPYVVKINLHINHITRSYNITNNRDDKNFVFESTHKSNVIWPVLFKLMQEAQNFAQAELEKSETNKNKE